MMEGPLVARGREVDDDTASRILDVAERLVQVRGFNAFSYADVAAELEISKAALHYHFAGKAELGLALITRYSKRFAEALAALDVGVDDVPATLDSYVDLYLDVMRHGRMCLCGMLAAEYHSLPASMRDAVVAFFDRNEAWLATVLERGRREGTVRFDGTPREEARSILAGLEGAMLVARTYGDLARFEAAASKLIRELLVKDLSSLGPSESVGPT